MRRRRVPVRFQSTVTECGAACIAMLASFYGRDTAVKEVRDDLGIGRDGTSLLELAHAARGLGLEPKAFRAPAARLAELDLPAAVHWDGSHFVVVEGFTRNEVAIVDPAIGRRRVPFAEFDARYGDIALTMRPGPGFVRRRRRRLGFFTFIGRFVPRSPRHLAAVLLASLSLVLLALLPPLVTQFVVDQVIPSGEAAVLTYLALGAGAFVLGHGALSLLRAELLLWLQTSIDRRLMMAFLRHLLSLPYHYFQLRHGGDLLVRVSSTAYVRDVVSGQLLALVLDAGLIVVYLVVIGVQSVEFVTALVVLAGGQAAVMALTAARAQRLTERELVAMGDSQSRLLETVSGIESIKSAGAEDAAYTRWAEPFHAQLESSVQRRRLDNAIAALLSGIRVGAPIAMILLGTVLVLRGQLTVGQMLALTALAGAALAPVGQLGQNLQSLQTVRVHLDRLRDVFDERPEAQGGGRQIDLHGGVHLDDVRFAYGRNAPPALDGITMRIEPGQRVAIVGPSGSGKSTLARIITGLLIPTDGEVAFDGLPLRDLDLVAVRRQCGVVTQAADVLSGTIRTNITLAAPNASTEDVARAAALAELHDDIARMPLGYDTILGEAGVGLSGGQLQRLALARALVHRPRILVLDEATSHLDAATEARVFANLAELRCTHVVIAHRLSTIQDADVIFVLNEGALVAQGTHQQLCVTSPLYAHLVAQQQRGSDQPSLAAVTS